MPEMLVLSNPRRRRARRSSAKKTRRVHANTVKRRTRRVRRNPSTAVTHIKRRIRRVSRVASNPRRHSRRRVRRNPISLHNMFGGNITSMFKDAALGGAGAVTVDLVMNQVQNFLPASMQAVGGQVGIFDVVRALVTVGLGKSLNKATRGLSTRMAMGALTVQAYQIAQSLMATYAPNMASAADNGNSAPSVATSTGTAGVGYATPNPVIRGTHRISPILRLSGAGVGAITPGRRAPLLAGMGQFSPGRSPLLAASRRRATSMGTLNP